MQYNRGRYTIRLEMLQRWASEHKLNVSGEEPQTQVAGCDESGFDSVHAAMQRGGIFYDVAGDAKATVLRAAMDQLPNIDPADINLVYDKLMEREQLGSTGIGHGIALPHARIGPVGVDDATVRGRLLKEYQLEIGAGLGALAGKVWRIGLMGHACNSRNVLYCLSALENVLTDLKAPIHSGVAVAAAHAKLEF